jgi:hypothetical protein
MNTIDPEYAALLIETGLPARLVLLAEIMRRAGGWSGRLQTRDWPDARAALELDRHHYAAVPTPAGTVLTFTPVRLSIGESHQYDGPGLAALFVVAAAIAAGRVQLSEAWAAIAAAVDPSPSVFDGPGA